VLFFLEE